MRQLKREKKTLVEVCVRCETRRYAPSTWVCCVEKTEHGRHGLVVSSSSPNLFGHVAQQCTPTRVFAFDIRIDSTPLFSGSRNALVEKKIWEDKVTKWRTRWCRLNLKYLNRNNHNKNTLGNCLATHFVPLLRFRNPIRAGPHAVKRKWKENETDWWVIRPGWQCTRCPSSPWRRSRRENTVLSIHVVFLSTSI